MGISFDRQSLFARMRQFESYAEWEWAHPETLSPALAIDVTGELCAIFPPTEESPEELQSKGAGVAIMRQHLARIGVLHNG